MSQAPNGNLFIVVEDDTIIHGAYRAFKSASVVAENLSIRYKKDGFRVKAFQVHPEAVNYIERIEEIIKDPKMKNGR
jgi:cysteinyl-tRNA synthetase